jgi:hypothetical protein
MKARNSSVKERLILRLIISMFRLDSYPFDIAMMAKIVNKRHEQAVS